MALAIFRHVLKVPQSLYITSTRLMCRIIPDDVEHATGLERKEIMALAEGNDNPFDMNTYKRLASTKDNPNLIRSAEPARMVGCLCEDDSISIRYMWLTEGEPKRCDCGHWFKITPWTPLESF